MGLQSNTESAVDDIGGDHDDSKGESPDDTHAPPPGKRKSKLPKSKQKKTKVKGQGGKGCQRIFMKLEKVCCGGVMCVNVITFK